MSFTETICWQVAVGYFSRCVKFTIIFLKLQTEKKRNGKILQNIFLEKFNYVCVYPGMITTE